MILYKYRNNSEYTEAIFKDRKVWLSNSEGLNDPFECSIQEIAEDWIAEHVKELKNGHISGFLHGAYLSVKDKTYFYDLTPSATKQFLKKFGKKDFDAQYKTVREFIFRKTRKEISNPEETFANFDKQLNEVGIFSLTEDVTNQLMWAHYADSNKGIALGFEVAEGTKLKDPEHCLQVNYSDELPKFKGKGFKNKVEFYATGKNIQKISFSDSTFQQAVTTKPTCWNYEKEWRYIEEIAGSYPFPSRLKEVVFGLKCPNEIRSKYIKLLNDYIPYHVDLFEIIAIPNTNKINKVKYEITTANTLE